MQWLLVWVGAALALVALLSRWVPPLGMPAHSAAMQVGALLGLAAAAGAGWLWFNPIRDHAHQHPAPKAARTAAMTEDA
jgi:hypothetical protein